MTLERPSPEIASVVPKVTDDAPDESTSSAVALSASDSEAPVFAAQPPATQTILKFFGANLVGRGIATTLAELEEKIARHADEHFLAVLSCSITVDNETGQRPYYIAAVVFRKLP